jgi:hypothetical protein
MKSVLAVSVPKYIPKHRVWSVRRRYSLSLYWHVRSCTKLSICNCNMPRAEAQTCLIPMTYVITELGGGLRWRKIKLRAIRWLTEDRFWLSPLFRALPKASYNGFIKERLTGNIASQEMNLMRLMNNEAAQWWNRSHALIKLTTPPPPTLPEITTSWFPSK